MKKKIVALMLCLTVMGTLCACDADKVNTAIDAVGDAAGVDTSNIKVDQKQIDAIADGVKKAGDAAKEIVEDEDVRNAVSNLGDALSDAVKDSQAPTEESE